MALHISHILWLVKKDDCIVHISDTSTYARALQWDRKRPSMRPNSGTRQRHRGTRQGQNVHQQKTTQLMSLLFS